MPQLPSSASARQWYRQTFEIKKKGKSELRHTLLVNPQDMSVQEPSRTNVQQTLGGAYVSHFGQGLHQVTLSGLTGYNARYNGEGQLTDGYEEMKNFRNKVYRDFIKSKSSQKEMFWYNWEDDEYYKIMPTSFRLSRSRSEPTLYRYELAFTTLKKVGKGTLPSGAGVEEPAEVDTTVISGAIATVISAVSEIINRVYIKKRK